MLISTKRPNYYCAIIALQSYFVNLFLIFFTIIKYFKIYLLHYILFILKVNLSIYIDNIFIYIKGIQKLKTILSRPQ